MSNLDQILHIKDIIDIPVRQLSLGQRMRGELAASMLHSPEILFLDEPTIGLDIDVKYSIQNFIKEINIKQQLFSPLMILLIFNPCADALSLLIKEISFMIHH